MNKKIKNKPTKVLLTVLSLCIFFGILFSATPNKVNYQGVLKEKGQLITGTKKMKFSIYDAETGGNLKWSSGVVDVEVKSGVFRYVLDFSNSNLPSDFWYKGKYYLEVEVEGQILSPREEIASGIYAIHAKEAEIAKEAQSVDWSDIKNKPPEFSGGELSANSIGSYHIIDSTITDADISPQANISWSKISKSGSSLGDLGDRDASHLTGILPPDRLSGEYLNNVKVSSAIYADIAGSAALGDNLGNHTATQDLDMGGHDILNVSTITSQSEGIYLATNVFVTQGNVGIGTTGPVVNLQVNGVNATDVSFFRVSDNVGTIFDVGRIGGSAGIYFGGNSNTRFRALGSSLEFVAQADTSADIIFRGRRNTLFQYYDGSSTTEKIRFDLSTGNVGIGTTSPGAKLEVRQAASDTYAVKVSSNDGTAMAVITNQGNVGIGTTNPSQKLTVYKSTAGDLASFGGNSANVPIYLHLSGDSNLNYIGGNVYYNGTNLTIDYTDRNSAFLKFSPGSNPLFSIGYASAGPNPRTETLALSMDNAGNVGIGTAAPSNKLTVDIGSAGPVDSGITIVGNTSSFGDLGLRIKNTGPGGIEWYIDSTNNNSGYGGGKLAFVPGIGSSPAMVLTNTGNVGIGTTGPSGRLHVRSTDTVNCAMRVDNPSGTSIVYVSTSSNVGIGTTSPGYKLQVGVSGDGTSAIANAWNTFSDIRLKEIIGNINSDEALNQVLKLQAVKFCYKNDETKKQNIGLIAQEVEKIVPEVVTTDDTEEHYKSIAYDKLVPILIEAIKEQQKEIEKLRLEIEELRKQK